VEAMTVLRNIMLMEKLSSSANPNKESTRSENQKPGVPHAGHFYSSDAA
jgi:hypothetical protein